jgi:dimethylhistidine N-methyltransferase
MSDIADVVVRGLTAEAKSLPPYLFYDAAGSALFERITELPEYYLTRAEREIFDTHAGDIVRDAARIAGRPLDVLELGAGTSTKTQVLLRELAKQQRGCRYFAADVSAAALDEGVARLVREERQVEVVPLEGTHEQSLRAAAERSGDRALLVLFIGSSIGNYEDDDAAALLRAMRAAMGRGGALLLGADLRKSGDVLVPAYDDAAGVTAAFNKNMLARINRELAADFDLERFRHVAVWNDAKSRVEMHLESTVDHEVTLGTVGVRVPFRRGERIHTESSHKYDDARIDALLGRAGLSREKTYTDRESRFAAHVAGAK